VPSTHSERLREPCVAAESQLVGTVGWTGAEEGSCGGCRVGSCVVGLSYGTGRGGCGGGTIVIVGSGLVDGNASGGSVSVVVGSSAPRGARRRRGAR